MKTMVLALGSTDYTRIKYPAGEYQVRLGDEARAKIADADDVRVVARIGSMDQVVELCLLCDAIDSVATARTAKALVLPYLPFARADRRFVDGDCFGLGVFARLINTTGWQVITLDAHSSKSTEQIARLTDVSSMQSIRRALKDFAAAQNATALTVLFPDEGARKRYHLPEETDGVRLHVLHCSKKRNAETGKLLGFNVPERTEFSDASGNVSPVIIVDDICDGGGTFIGIADSLKDYGLKIALYVTHGIFAKGMAPLLERFSDIYTTDSFKSWESTDKLHVIPAVEDLIRTELAVCGHR